MLGPAQAVDGREDFYCALAGSERGGVQGDRVTAMLLQGWCTSICEQGGEELEEEMVAVH